MNDNKITIAELDKEMNDRIIRNIKYMFKVRKEVGKSLNDLGTYCEEKYNISVNTGNLSSLLNKKRNGNIQLALLYYICEYLNVDMQEMMWKEMDEVSKVFSEFSVTTDKFIIAARDMKKYLGKERTFSRELQENYPVSFMLRDGTSVITRPCFNGSPMFLYLFRDSSRILT